MKTNTGYTQSEQREIAISAARYQLTKNGNFPDSAQVALVVLDELLTTDKDLVASIWYENASDNQIRLFKQEWNKACSGT
jgi:hypothetical protein